MKNFEEAYKELPALTGTEKQVDWANTIRRERMQSWYLVAVKVDKQITDVRAAMQDEANIQKGMEFQKLTREQFLALVEKSIDALIAKNPSYTDYMNGLTETRATWWIDRR